MVERWDGMGCCTTGGVVGPSFSYISGRRIDGFLLAWLGSGLCGKMGRKLIFGIISDFVRG